jgi:N-acetylneuraminate synthase
MTTLVIAEVGVNHDGKLARALELVDAAAQAGADVVKFQTFRAAELATASAPKAEYQRALTDANETQAQMLKRLELDEHAHKALMRRCEARGVEFLSTAFDLPSVELLLRLGLRRFKVPSGEIHNAPLLVRLARGERPMILSTGMCTLADVEAALGLIAAALLGSAAPTRADAADAWRSEEGRRRVTQRVTLLHCTSEYPAPLGSINLAALTTLREAFGLPVGYSDHSLGIAVAIAATALRATVIEKHITLDRRLPGPDHKASLEPQEFAAMVEGIRAAEVALGSSEKAPSAAERSNAGVVRKSLVALRPITAGERFTPENLGAKRPGLGVSPLRYFEYIGRPASRAYSADEAVDP